MTALTPNTTFGPTQLRFTRDSLIRYAGASGDFNPIHWSDSTARAVGLPGVIAHGMLTMGAAASVLVGWLGGDPGRIKQYAVRFSRPVPVPEAGAAELTVTGQVAAVEDGYAVINLVVSLDGVKVLGKARAEVTL